MPSHDINLRILDARVEPQPDVPKKRREDSVHLPPFRDAVERRDRGQMLGILHLAKQ